MTMTDAADEMWELLNALCERRLTPAQAARLESLVLQDPEARWQYLTYLNLHGNLYWDAAGGLAIKRLETDQAETRPIPAAAAAHRNGKRFAGWASLAGLAVVLAIGLVWWRIAPPPQLGPRELANHPVDPSPAAVPRAAVHGQRAPVKLRLQDAASQTPEESPDESVASTGDVKVTPLADPNLPSSVQHPVALINQEIRQGWEAANITPSERADDAAWLRRVSVDLAGHIPSAADVKTFLADRSPDKRERLIDRLLDDPQYARHLTTQWMNLLVGRSSPPQVNRPSLQKFLRTSFAANRGWDAIVTDLVAAEGRSDENGAANFLIAHLNNQAVPATAVTARLFLGVQVQCTQCHNHPSEVARASGRWSHQTDFWEFNSFFHQTKSQWLIERNPATGEVKSQVMELVSQPLGGPTYYETPNGLMKAVYPRYHDRKIDADPDFNRRRELARLMVEVDGDQLAAAFVNRAWQHFFGHGFTPQIDDLGPHNQPSHPELLRGLSAAFRQSGYDIKQLTRWICLSEPYQLSSRFHDGNKIDDPDRGETPLFSHVYPQPMSVEQLYDSFLMATKAHQHQAGDWTAAEAQRQAWLSQFIISFQTEENDEANTFEGTVTQALTLMNGPLMEKALETSSGTYLGEVLRAPGGETEKIEQLCLATLSRKPSSKELAAMHKLLRKSSAGVEGYQDLFWALLNSNEFAATY
jgi:hypothetical protein